MSRDSPRRTTPDEDKALAMSNLTCLRVPQDFINRCRVLARKRSEKLVDRDVTWQVIGRELLERALCEEERRTFLPNTLA
jgi:hypothetical protein